MKCMLTIRADPRQLRKSRAVIKNRLMRVLSFLGKVRRVGRWSTDERHLGRGTHVEHAAHGIARGKHSRQSRPVRIGWLVGGGTFEELPNFD